MACIHYFATRSKDVLLLLLRAEQIAELAAVYVKIAHACGFAQGDLLGELCNCNSALVCKEPTTPCLSLNVGAECISSWI